MTPLWVTVVFGCGTILSSLLGAAVVYGGLKEKTNANSRAIAKQGEQLEQHEGEIGFVYGRLGIPRH